MTPQSFLLLCSLSLFSACTGEITGDDFHGDEQDLGNIQITTQRVRDFETSTCSTASVAALSRQIAEEMLCMAPGVVSKLEAQGGLSFTSSAVLPYMEAEAAQDLLDAAAEVPIILNSGFRTVVQQYLLRKWFERGRCGIPSAARPGRSNHESGRAIDVANRAQAKSALRRHGWRDPLQRDPVHFEHRSSPDMRGLDVHAFQRLWNRNNPSDTISEDGEYGPNTESRLRKSPAAGFSIGPSCAGSDAANWVGDSCESDAGCELPNGDGSCSSWFDANSDQLQGMCTSSCNGVCPQRSGERTSFCADTGQSEGLCVPQSVGGSEGCLGVTGSRLLPLRRFEQNGLRSQVQTVCAPPQTAAISCQSDNRQGECIDTDVSECPGDLVHGVCPGGNSIRCCLQ
ncbi:MAG: M15 family metallopeptidase [Kofleriaceae bacterium]|nr:M15 family metallopeptidase [Kofleriaceae bacterium]